MALVLTSQLMVLLLSVRIFANAVAQLPLPMIPKPGLSGLVKLNQDFVINWIHAEIKLSKLHFLSRNNLIKKKRALQIQGPFNIS